MNPFYVRFRRAALRAALLKLERGAALPVWLNLALRADNTGASECSLASLAEETAYSRREVLRALRQLEQAGFLTVKRADGEINTYQIAARYLAPGENL